MNDNILVGFPNDKEIKRGQYNVAIGIDSFIAPMQGSNNVCIGYEAAKLATGNCNTIVGSRAANHDIFSGNNNTFIGHSCGSNVTTASNVIIMGNKADGKNISNTMWLPPGILSPSSIGDDTLHIDITTGQITRSASGAIYKSNIENADMNTSLIDNLTVKKWNYIDRYVEDNGEIIENVRKETSYGLVADDVYVTIPDAVKIGDYIIRDGEKEYVTKNVPLNHDDRYIMGLIIETLKESRNRIKNLEEVEKNDLCRKLLLSLPFILFSFIIFFYWFNVNITLKN